MTQDLRDTLQNLLDSSDVVKINYGKKAISDLMNLLPLDIESTMAFIEDLIKLLVSADLKCHGREHEYCMATTPIKMDRDEFYEETNCGADPKFKYRIYRFIEQLDNESFARVARFASGLFSYDEEISSEELLLLDELLRTRENGW